MSTVVLGALAFGTRVDEAASMRLLDQFVDAGGVWIDTANCYTFWLSPTGAGGQSETVIGRWLTRRPGMRDRVRISTKCGMEPDGPGEWPASAEGLSAAAITTAVAASLRRLQTPHLDLYWAHAEDRGVPLDETVAAFGALVADGTVARLGASNHPAWRVERARALAARHGVSGYSALQLRWSYLRPRPAAVLPESGHRHASEETLDYVRSTDGMELWAYNTLLNGSYTRADRPLGDAYDHPGTARRMAALRQVAADHDATVNQVVLAWLRADAAPIRPIVGVTSAEHIAEAMSAATVELTGDQLALLDAAA